MSQQSVKWQDVGVGDFGLYFVNYIGIHNDHYYCHLCAKKFQTVFLTLAHVQERKHKESKNVRISDEIVNAVRLPSASLYQEMVLNGIFMKNQTFFECMLCDCKLDLVNLHAHMHGKRHQKHKLDFSMKLMLLTENSTTQDAINPSLSTTKRSKKWKFFPRNNRNSGNSVAQNTRQAPINVLPAPRQFNGIIYKNEDLDDINTLCHVCFTVIPNRVMLHIHLTWHFWPRFDPTSSVKIVTKLPPLNYVPAIPNTVMANGVNIYCGESRINTKNIIPEYNTKTFPSLLSTMKKTMQKPQNDNENKIINILENPVKVAGKSPDKFNATGDSARGMSVLQRLEQMSKELANLENIKEEMPELKPLKPISQPKVVKTTKKSSKKTKINQPDIDSEGLNFMNIYRMDGEQLKNIKLSIVMSCITNKNDIYCLICCENYRNTLQNVLEHVMGIKHCDYLKQITEDHLNFKTFPDQFSDLALALEFMHEISDDFVQCFVCHCDIANEIASLVEHISSKRHVKRSKKNITQTEKLFQSLEPRMARDWYCVQRYWCVPCGLKTHIEVNFLGHLHSRKHQKNCAKFLDHEDLIFDYCATCTTLWCGFRNTFAYHCECKMHKYHSRDNFFIITELPKVVKKLMVADIEKTIDQMLMNINAKADKEKTKEAHLLRDLKAAIIVKFEQVKLHAFGSRVSGVATSSSDLDVFVDCENNYNLRNEELSHRYYLKEVELCLKEKRDIWAIDRTVLDCRIPIIKLYHKPTGIECDISFKNGITVENSKLIRAYNDKFPMCQKLIIFMKQWLNHCDLSGINGIPSYGIALLVIYYLQTKSILPSVGDLIEWNGESKFIGYWETGVKRDFPINHSANNYSFNELLKGLFIFYNQFDYRHEVVCPLMGSPVRKLDFQVLENLPINMEPYKMYVETTREPELFPIDSPLCVQDPFDLTNNITKAVKKFTVYRFKKFCLLSSQML